MIIHDSLVGRIELAVLGVLGWIAIALLTHSAPTFRLTWIGKVIYIVILLLIVLGIPLLQMALTSPSRNQSQINYVFSLIMIEGVVGILIILFTAYKQRS